MASDILDACPNWIEFINYEDNFKNNPIEKFPSNSLVFRGGCDLSQSMQYLTKSFKVVDETNYVTNQNVPVHADHTMVILDQFDNKKQLPFLPIKKLSSKVFDRDYDVVISVLMDYTQDLYINKIDGSLTPIGGYQSKSLYKQFSGETGRVIDNFFETSENIGQISKDDFYDNLSLLRTKLDKKQRLFIINGAEIKGLMVSEDELARHILMNKVVDKFIKNHKDTFLIDVRKLALSENDLVDSIRHYKRHVYFKIAKEIISFYDVNTRYFYSFTSFFLKRIINKVKKIFFIQTQK